MSLYVAINHLCNSQPTLQSRHEHDVWDCIAWALR